MKNRVATGILAALVCGLISSAETLELKTGERIDGAFKQATSAGVVIEVAGQSVTIGIEKVRAIYFGAAPAPLRAGPTALEEAMGALKGIRSATESGISFRDYTQM